MIIFQNIDLATIKNSDTVIPMLINNYLFEMTEVSFDHFLKNNFFLDISSEFSGLKKTSDNQNKLLEKFVKSITHLPKIFVDSFIRTNEISTPHNIISIPHLNNSVKICLMLTRELIE